MGYRVVRTGDAWARVLWPQDQKHDLWLVSALKLLKRIPGVRLEDRYLELPCTVWNLALVQVLWEKLGATSPERPMFTPAFAHERLYEHQQLGAHKILGTKGLLLADQMGLGKTATAIAAAQVIRDGHPDRPALIVSTLSSRNVWRMELAAMGENVEAHFRVLQSRDVVGVQLHPRGWYFVHFDIALAWQSKIQGMKPCVVIVDEAHNVRNGRTQRGKGVYAITACAPRKILLTGTPIDNHPSDLWHLLTMITGPNTWGSPTEFRVRYCGASHNGHGYQDNDPSNVEELQQRLAPYYLRRTTADVALQLPALTRQLHTTALSAPNQHEHDEVLKGCDVAALVRAIQSGSLKDDVLATLTRLRQVTSAGKVHSTVSYLQNLQEQGEGAVVFTWEKATAHAIGKLLGVVTGVVPFVVTGDTPQHEREVIISQFQETPGAILIATLGSLRESVTLHAARIVVMHDWHWVLSHLLQAEGRVWRTGQLRACQSVWMMAENSIDTILARVLYAKSTAMQSIGIDAGRQALEELGIAQLARDAASERVNEMLEAWL